MNPFSPKPRFRIYSSPLTYISILKDNLFKSINKGCDTDKLINIIKQSIKADFALCLPQARVGIYLAVKAIIKPGQNVILSPYTIADVINMVICAGGIPIFADIEQKTCNIAPSNIEKLINKNTGAILITHLHGLSCSIDKIIKICRKFNIPLIEDAAQAFGAKFEGKDVGTFGNVGIYSFGRYKTLTSFYGGMLVTGDHEIYKSINLQISQYQNMSCKQFNKQAFGCLIKDILTTPPLFQILIYNIFRFGHLRDIKIINRFIETELDISKKEKIPEQYLRQMTQLQARLILSKFHKVKSENLIRIQYAKIYYDGLRDIPEILLPPLREDESHIYTYFPIQYFDRQALVKWMIKQRQDVGIQHLKNCADLPAFNKYFRDCPIARNTAKQVILLPTYPRYGEGEVRNNIQAIRSFFKK